MQLRDAISDLKEIRAQLDRASGFRGFRSLTVGLSGIFTFVGAMLQLALHANWQDSLRGFLWIWLAVALCSLSGTMVEIWVRSLCSSTPFVWKTYRNLAIQIAPSFFVGAVLTLSVVFSGRAGWMLPGMWSLIYSLGLFACCQHLPRQSIWAAYYYLVGGTVCLWHSFILRGTDTTFSSAWYMVVLFGGGQFLLGWILYWTLERRHDQED